MVRHGSKYVGLDVGKTHMQGNKGGKSAKGGKKGCK